MVINCPVWNPQRESILGIVSGRSVNRGEPAARTRAHCHCQTALCSVTVSARPTLCLPQHPTAATSYHVRALLAASLLVSIFDQGLRASTKSGLRALFDIPPRREPHFSEPASFVEIH